MQQNAFFAESHLRTCGDELDIYRFRLGPVSKLGIINYRIYLIEWPPFYFSISKKGSFNRRDYSEIFGAESGSKNFPSLIHRVGIFGPGESFFQASIFIGPDPPSLFRASIYRARTVEFFSGQNSTPNLIFRTGPTLLIHYFFRNMYLVTVINVQVS